MAYDDLVARFTLAGSMTSCIATSFVLLSYLIFRDQQHSFRHALILNLALAGTLHPNAEDDFVVQRFISAPSNHLPVRIQYHIPSLDSETDFLTFCRIHKYSKQLDIGLHLC